MGGQSKKAFPGQELGSAGCEANVKRSEEAGRSRDVQQPGIRPYCFRLLTELSVTFLGTPTWTSARP